MLLQNIFGYIRAKNYVKINAGLEFEKNKGKASLSLNVTKFFKASRPVHRASRFKYSRVHQDSRFSSLKILFSCYFEVSNNV
jgi:hypothetical protein